MSKHTDRYRTADSCKKGHGIGLSICRVCVKGAKNYTPKHKKDNR